MSITWDLSCNITEEQKTWVMLILKRWGIRGASDVGYMADLDCIYANNVQFQSETVNLGSVWIENKGRHLENTWQIDGFSCQMEWIELLDVEGNVITPPALVPAKPTPEPKLVPMKQMQRPARDRKAPKRFLTEPYYVKQ